MVEINLSARGSFERDEFAIGTTSKNNYYPFYSQLSKEQISETDYMYYKPTHKRGYGISRYSELFETLTSRMFFSRFNFTVNDKDHHVLVMKGYIANHLKQTLFMLSVKDYNTFNLVSQYHEEPDYKKFKLFIATEFITNPIYSNLWRKIDKEYVQKCHELGIAVEFNTLENLDTFFFSNEFELEYNNLTELQAHLNNNVAPLLFEDFRYTPSYSDEVDDTPRISVEQMCANAVVSANNRLTAENLVTFVERYYSNHGSSPDDIYVRTSGVTVFVFNSSRINHSFTESQILDFISNNGYTPIPESIDDIYSDNNLPVSLIEQNDDPINQDELEASIITIVDNTDYSEQDVRLFVQRLQADFPSGVRLLEDMGDGDINVIYGDYDNYYYEPGEFTDIVNSMRPGAEGEEINVVMSENYIAGVDPYTVTNDGSQGTPGIVSQIQEEAVVYNSNDGISREDFENAVESLSGISPEEQEAAQQDIAEAEQESDGGFDLVDDTEDEEPPF